MRTIFRLAGRNLFSGANRRARRRVAVWLALALPAAVRGELLFEFESLAASDVGLQQADAARRWQGAAWQAKTGLEASRIIVDYRPAAADIVTRPLRRHATRHSARIDSHWDHSPRWRTILGSALYRGFSDYRSLWIDEHDRQLFSGTPGYRFASPRGWHVVVGERWAWRPADRWLEGSFVHQHDKVAPGYEPQIGGPLVRGRDRLRTHGLRVALEQIATPALRLRFECAATDTTGRAVRHTVSSAANWAVTERWVLRGSAGAARESPGFSARWLQVALDRDWADHWFAGLLVRDYRDSGEIADSLVPSNAAPPLRTLHAALSLRWQGERHAFRFEIGPYRTAYGALPAANAQFAQLYRDRSWFRAQLALSRDL